MPTARETGHRIRSGTQTVGNVTASYAISALPTQTDQGELLWVLDTIRSTHPQPARIVETLDRTSKGDGKYSFQWVFKVMTIDMYDYWCDTFLTGGVWSASVTVMTYDDSDTAVYLTCTLKRPVTLTRYIGSYVDVVFQFVEGTIIT